MNRSLKFVVFGTGNVSYHFTRALIDNEFEIIQLVGRTLDNTKKLAESFSIEYTISLENVRTDADVYLYCISDDSLVEIANQAIAPHALHIHTSGSLDMNLFLNTKKYFGVIYPLQTLSINKEIDFKSKVPFFIEASNNETLEIIKYISDKISDQVNFADSQKRLNLHISAVFACNFVNHFYSIASDLLDNVGIDFNYLKPLILETADKIKFLKPTEAQTGPAKRNDQTIIKTHLSILNEHPDLQEIYKLLSTRIYNEQTKTASR